MWVLGKFVPQWAMAKCCWKSDCEDVTLMKHFFHKEANFFFIKVLNTLVNSEMW